MAIITEQRAGGVNRCAFLDMIAWSEGTSRIPNSDDGYRVLVGATPAHPLLFDSYVAHPNVLNKAFDSTAAGRYQEKWSNWVSYSKSLSLRDFGPLSQDQMALQQIRERGALPFIDIGNFEKAVRLCSNIWASLPGNGYGQHTNTILQLEAAYTGAGGALIQTA